MTVSSWLRFVVGVCSGMLAACSSDAQVADVVEPGGSCNVGLWEIPQLSAQHVPDCSPIEYAQNPPAGGDHYSTWAAFQDYSFPVPRGFWVHDLEHGAIVYSYHCPEGCAAEVAEVAALIAALPSDPRCTGQPTARRVVLTPDPLLDARWAISAWGRTLRADCVDKERFRRFYSIHVGQGPEDLCAPGSDFGGVAPCE